VLAVRDSGPGIDPEVLPHIFEPFYTTRKDGLGLGLSLCESLASGMAGRLSVSAVSPRGTRFSLQLPLASA
jgi:C4-dicarboxylate-specific signal transduction histidine kinase